MASQGPKAPHSIKGFLMYFIRPTAMGLVLSIQFIVTLNFFFILCIVFIPFDQIEIVSSARFDLINAIDGIGKDANDIIFAVNYLALAIQAAIIYVLSNALYAMLVYAGKIFKVFRFHMIVFLILIFAAFMFSIIYSRIYWGYYFYPPKVITQLNEIKEVNRLIPVETKHTGRGDYRIVHDPKYDLAYQLSWLERFSPWWDFSINARILSFLKAKGMLPKQTNELAQNETDYYGLIKNTGIMVEPDPGYKRSVLLRGLIVEATDSAKRDLVLIAVSGGELSNDHHPYYELLFEKKPGANQLTYIRGQHFFYDDAGQEPLTWSVVWFLLSFTIAYFALLLTILVAVAKGIIRWLAPKLRPHAPAP